MRAKIENGKIRSIGHGAELPFELPTNIDFGNFKEFVCVNIEDVSNMASWKHMSEVDLETFANPTKNEAHEAVEPEVEEVVITPKPSPIVVFFYVIAIVFLVLSGIALGQTYQNEPQYFIPALMLIGAILGYTVYTTYNQVKRWF